MSTAVQPRYVPDPVGPGVANEWGLLLDTGQGLVSVEGVLRAAFVNEKREIGFLFGESPTSSGFRFAQVWRVGGGGGVTILWTRNPFGKLYVGAVLQDRKFIDTANKVLNVIRGYAEPKETTRETILRELIEESGRIDLLTAVQLPGNSANMDSAILDGPSGGFVDFFATQVPWELLKPSPDGNDTYVFDTEGLTEEQRREGIFGCIFVEGDLATLAAKADGFTIIAFARLLAAMGRH